MTKRPWFPWYVADWRLSRTVRLMGADLRGFAARGLYADCLSIAWEDGGLPTDPDALATLLGTTRDVLDQLWPLLASSWIVKRTRDGDRLVNPRQETERRKANKITKVRRKSGKSGGRPRKQTESNEEANALAELSISPIQSQSQSQSQKPTPVRPARPDAPSPGFVAFKAIYPRREKWPDAAKAWRQVKAEAATEAIVADVQRRLTDGTWTDPQFIPLPASYLRGRRWEDEPPAITATSRPALTPEWRRTVENYAGRLQLSWRDWFLGLPDEVWRQACRFTSDRPRAEVVAFLEAVRHGGPREADQAAALRAQAQARRAGPPADPDAATGDAVAAVGRAPRGPA